MVGRYDLFGVGAALLDIECHVDAPLLSELGLDKGSMTLSSHEDVQRNIEQLGAQGKIYGESCGGSAANAVITASHLGANAYFACRVDNDAMGEIFLRGLAQAGIGYRPLGGVQGGQPTGRCLVLLTGDAERTLQTALGSNLDIAPDDIDAAALAASRYAYIEGYLVGSENGLEVALHARRLATAAAVPIAISLSDVNIVKHCREGLDQLFGDDGVDLLFCNRAEALAWSGADTLESASPALAALARCVVVTAGADGAILIHEGQTTQIEPHPVVPINTNGAGDAFAGVFLYSLIRGYSLLHAGNFANYVAAHLAKLHGGRLTEQICRQLNEDFLPPKM